MDATQSQLEALLDEAIHCDLNLVQLEAAASSAENAITKKRADLAEAETAEADLRDSIRVREKRLSVLLEDTRNRRYGFVKDYFANKSFKYGLKDESAIWLGENAQAEILKASINYGLSLIPGLAAATRKANLHVLEASLKWLKAEGLRQARIAYELFLPLLQNDPSSQIDLRVSKTASYALEILAYEQRIAEWHSKELIYGPSN